MGLALVAGVGCKDKGAPTKADPATAAPSSVELDKRCEQVAKVCGDQAKHVAKILDACKLAATQQVEKGCAATAIATYDCYVKEVCGGGDKVGARRRPRARGAPRQVRGRASREPRLQREGCPA
ncbi:MAG: hypothetical protein NT062_33555 [Proteobacteria bacterium]|nr:hypothetical protein [Pseudomonadota bacterium]